MGCGASSASFPVGTTQQDIDAFVKAHNDERRARGAAPLSWSNSLSKYAYEWAKELDSKGPKQLIHRTNLTVGENLYWTSNPKATLMDAAQLWMREKAILGSGNEFVQSAGHYTQMIWSKTREVGAAVVKNSTGTYIVANYSPAGNVVGEPVIQH